MMEKNQEKEILHRGRFIRKDIEVIEYTNELSENHHDENCINTDIETQVVTTNNIAKEKSFDDQTSNINEQKKIEIKENQNKIANQIKMKLKKKI